jgi:NADPH:quinone reductase-like Zn-dependent oxidoreductase
MKAWVQHRYGNEDALELDTNARTPAAGDDEVLVRVHAAGLNAADVHLMTGKPLLVRMVKGLRRPRVPALGTDFAGVVEQVGPSVTHIAPGDRVMGEVDRGSLAELVVAPGKSVAHQPAGASHVEAAALPMTAFTALQALRDGDLKSGERVLVNGASSGVGVQAVQIAVALGAKVTGVCSGRNADLVRSLGAVDVIDYTTTDFTDTVERYDLLVDIVSTKPLSRCRSILTPSGRIVIVGAVSKGPVVGMGRQIRASLLSPLTRGSIHVTMAASDRSDLQTIAGMVERGEVRPVIDTVYDFEHAPDAVGHVRAGHARGKVIVRVNPQDE